MSIEFVNPITAEQVKATIAYNLYHASCREFVLSYINDAMKTLDGKTVTKRFERVLDDLNLGNVACAGYAFRAWYAQEFSWIAFKIEERSLVTREFLESLSKTGIESRSQFQESVIIIYDNQGKVFDYNAWYERHMRGSLECARSSKSKAERAAKMDVVGTLAVWNGALNALKSINSNMEDLGLQYLFDIRNR